MQNKKISSECNTIGIIGYGFVGKATSQLSEDDSYEVYDPIYDEYSDNLQAYEQDLVFVCVPTPTVNNEVDLSIIHEVVDKWSSLKKRDSILIIKSTVPSGTIDELCSKYSTTNIIHNPEFLTERTANYDFLNPVEVVLGGSKESCLKVKEVYEKFYQNDKIKYYITSAKEAELLKTTRNSFYALKVTFFNEVYNLCNNLGIDYDSFIKMFSLDGEHPWIGNQHMMVPGPDGKFGFGGKCLPKDSEGLYGLSESLGCPMELLNKAIEINKTQRSRPKPTEPTVIPPVQ